MDLGSTRPRRPSRWTQSRKKGPGPLIAVCVRSGFPASLHLPKQFNSPGAGLNAPSTTLHETSGCSPRPALQPPACRRASTRFPIVQTQHDGDWRPLQVVWSARTCGGGCSSVMPAPDSRKRSPTGRLRCRPVLPCGVSTPRTGHLESLKSAADPTDWPSSPTPPEPSVSPTFRRVQSHPSVPRTKSPEPSRWPMTKIRGRLCRSSTPRFCRRQSILPLYGQSCSFRHQAMSSLVLDCGGLADGSCRIPTSTKTTLTLLLEEV